MYKYSGGVVLTGVGLYASPQRGAFIAPPDPTARWDDPGYAHPVEDEFAVMGQRKINGRLGFIFHEACWSLLERAFHPASVPVIRVFEVCDSLPEAMGGESINWGHDYGGLAIVKDAHSFPWEDRFSDRQFPQGWFDTPYSADPGAVSEADEILAGTPPTSPPLENSSLYTRSTVLSNEDPFSSFPTELCSAVAEYLLTPDAMNARQASRSFWHLFHSQQFWASRFRGMSDRSWLFEAHNHNSAGRDWRWLYRCTTDSQIGPGLRNRKRIWALIQHLTGIVELQWSQLSSVVPALDQGQNWVLAAGSMPVQQPEGFTQLLEGCWCFRKERVAIPEAISQVSTSTVRVGNSEYIAGILLRTISGDVLQLGYAYSKARSPSVQLSGLAGFNLAVGLGGILALQCIDEKTGEASAWLGCPDDAPKTERLSIGTRTTALEVGFDVGAHSSLLTISFSPCSPANIDVARASGWSA